MRSTSLFIVTDPTESVYNGFIKKRTPWHLNAKGNPIPSINYRGFFYNLAIIMHTLTKGNVHSILFGNDPYLVVNSSILYPNWPQSIYPVERNTCMKTMPL